MRHRLIAYAQHKFFVKLYFVEDMTMGCILLTDSGGVKRYVAGPLDSGKLFAEKCSSQYSEIQ